MQIVKQPITGRRFYHKRQKFYVKFVQSTGARSFAPFRLRCINARPHIICASVIVAADSTPADARVMH